MESLLFFTFMYAECIHENSCKKGVGSGSESAQTRTCAIESQQLS